MSMRELKRYVLENRQDKEAWEEFASRPRPNAITLPADTTQEEFVRILSEALNQKQ